MKILLPNLILIGVYSFQLTMGLTPASTSEIVSSTSPQAVQSSSSQVINVPSQMDLQSAINEITNGGVIQIAAGTYPVPSNGYILNELHKGFKIQAQPGASVILDGGSARSLLRFQNTALSNGGWVTFEGLTFANGYSNTSGLAAGVTMMNSQGTFINCVFTNNTAAINGTGGGVLVAVNSTALFANNSWQNNSSLSHGAGMAVADHSKVYVHNSQFINNRTNVAGQTQYSAGGAIHIGNSAARISNTRFDSNQAGYVGGAVYAIGTWGNAWTTDVIISNSTFVNNKALSSISLPYPTEGGAVHVESQASIKIYNSRFITNSADAGGAISDYLGTLLVDGGVFLGNQAVGMTMGGYGGAITGNSNDTPIDGSTNRPPVKITVNNSYFQGRYGTVTTVALGGGGIFLGGDYNRQYAQGGVSQMGGLADNRAQLTITGSAFANLDVTKSDGGIGGAIYAGLTDLNMQNSSIILSDTTGTNGSGGGISLISQSRAVINNSTLAKNSSSRFGGAVYSDGSELNISNSKVIENSVATLFGGGIFASSNSNTQLGTISGNVITNNIASGSTINNVYDDDRAGSGTNIFYNQTVYNANTFFGSGGTAANLYSDSVVGMQTVPQLNSLVINRAVGGPTVKSTVDNTALSSAPAVGSLVAVPNILLSSGAPGDANPPVGSYLTYAWSGGSAKLDNSSISGNAGTTPVQATGTHTLTVGSNSPAATVSQAPLPAGTVAVSGSYPAMQIAWSVTGGTFLEGMIDQGANIPSAPSGTISVSPPVDNLTYHFYAITKEGGVFASSLSQPILSAPTSSGVIDGKNLPSHTFMIPFNNSGSGTLVWTATKTSGSVFTLLTQSGQSTGPGYLVIQITSNNVGTYTGSIQVDGGSAGTQNISLVIHIVPEVKRIFIPAVKH